MIRGKCLLFSFRTLYLGEDPPDCCKSKWIRYQSFEKTQGPLPAGVADREGIFLNVLGVSTGGTNGYCLGLCHGLGGLRVRNGIYISQLDKHR